MEILKLFLGYIAVLLFAVFLFKWAIYYKSYLNNLSLSQIRQRKNDLLLEKEKEDDPPEEDDDSEEEENVDDTKEE